MVNPISETTSVSINTEVINKSQNNNAHKSDKPYGPSGIKKSESEGANHKTVKGAGGEIRKSELSDGELTVSVYDSSGKLLRKIPPGYLPMGEQQFDITV